MRRVGRHFQTAHTFVEQPPISFFFHPPPRQTRQNLGHTLQPAGRHLTQHRRNGEQARQTTRTRQNEVNELQSDAFVSAWGKNKRGSFAHSSKQQQSLRKEIKREQCKSRRKREEKKEEGEDALCVWGSVSCPSSAGTQPGACGGAPCRAPGATPGAPQTAGRSCRAAAGGPLPPPPPLPRTLPPPPPETGSQPESPASQKNEPEMPLACP